MLCWLPAAALDNPDAPDLVAEFLVRSAPYEERAAMQGGGGRDAALAYRACLSFLDAELNRAYRLLMSKLDSQQQYALINAQQQWLAFRDAVFQFIGANWTRDRFGSSATLSVGDYRCTLTKQRVIQLLLYAKNYY
jgi:uncharacterized protein YecT (DUF1311 family)